ncbi:hypothetical protein T484DRAFT_1799708 [Baffinella frigidus]|nr:hypothetical protein T484DRAFT_1799708 [Cryptophyta sp. CCMP2293]
MDCLRVTSWFESISSARRAFVVSVQGGELSLGVAVVTGQGAGGEAVDADTKRRWLVLVLLLVLLVLLMLVLMGGSLGVLELIQRIALAQVLRLGVALTLMHAGTMFLAATISLSDLLLNAVALEFVLSVDELLFEALAPGDP